ncbi:MAG: 3-keto-disaccharide hydrolase [Rhodothermales bacterium]
MTRLKLAPALFLLLVCIPTSAATAQTSDADTTFTPLWDGETFDGWHQLEGGEWTIEDGAIVGRSTTSEDVYGLLITDDQYGDFTVRLQFMALSGNSGFYIRAREVGGTVGVNGFQAEIDATRDVGGIYETGGRGWVDQPDSAEVAEYFKPGEWNDMTIEAEGRNVTVYVNGVKSAEITDDPSPTEGHFALQLHAGQDMEVRMRNVAVRGEPIREGE